MKRFTCSRWAIFIFLFIFIPPAFAINLNLLYNPGFETKSLENWSAFDSCRFELSKRAIHTGKFALVFHPLKDGAGVGHTVSQILTPGYRYRFSGWLRNLEAGWGQVDVWLVFRQQGNDRQIVIGRGDCNKSDWVNISNEFFIPGDADPAGLQLVIKAAWGQIAFVIDDLELRPALHIGFIRATPRSDPDLHFQMGLPSKERSKLDVQVDIFDQMDRVLEHFTQAMDVPIHKALAPGFYRIAASVTDLDERRFSTERIGYYGVLDSLTANLDKQMNRVLTSTDLSRYHGWLFYLKYRVTSSSKKESSTADHTLQELFRLNRWIQEIRINPGVLNTLTGVQEWAYLSRIDDSGQPFKLAIPSGYDSKKMYPLVVVMHGYGGNHMEYSGGVRSNPDYFELHVLGRARGGGYVDLSEADVLAAVEYVEKNWSIDKRRIHLTGASMGGGGTFRLAVRYPDLWASGRPVCGYGSDLPIRNARHVPIYSTHSQDDPTVPVLASRAPLQKLMQADGQVIIDETIGLQHAAWNYAEGNARAFHWMSDQVLPDFREVEQVEYMAIDRQACAAYWLKIEEWGNQAGPACFRGTAGEKNQLYLRLENINRLLVTIVNSPFDQNQDLKISVNGSVPFILSAPLADSILIICENGKWSAGVNKMNKPGVVLHTAGGVHNLYHNEPLLIVYGTTGDSLTKQYLAQAALAASKSPTPMWVGDLGDIKEGVPNHQLLYGYLKIKPDTAVTQADLEKYNLLLIGTMEENRLVQQLQKHLPVQFGNEIICSDGVRLPGTNSMLGLYYYNPLASDRLIYWVAADNPADYKPYNLLLQLQNDSPCGTDLLVVRTNPAALIKIRSFDSRWNWSSEFSNSARIATEENTYGDVFRRVAESIRKVSGSDFSLQQIIASPELQAGISGLTQWSDFALLYLTAPIAIVHLRGSHLPDYQKAISERGLNLSLYPLVDKSIAPDRIYQISLHSTFYEIQQLINMRQDIPDFFEITDITVFEAMKKVLF